MKVSNIMLGSCSSIERADRIHFRLSDALFSFAGRASGRSCSGVFENVSAHAVLGDQIDTNALVVRFLVQSGT